MIKDVHHVGIAVRDMDEALALYRDTLGLPMVNAGDAPARGAKAALLAVGRSYLEIVQPVTDTSPFAEYIKERGQGLHHVALGTDDVDSQVAALREAGVPLEDGYPREGFTGRLSYLAPEAFDGALLEVVQPPPAPRRSEPSGPDKAAFTITRIDHVVLRVPSVDATCARFQDWFGVPTKRTFERGETKFAFMRPGDVVIEVIGPKSGAEPNSACIAGLAFEVKGIDEIADTLKRKGYPVGEPHAALQGGSIVSIHYTGASGVPVAFIDFTGSPR